MGGILQNFISYYHILKNNYNKRSVRGTLIVISSLIQFTTFYGFINSYSEYLPILKGKISNSESFLGAIISISMFLILILTPFSYLIVKVCGYRKTILIGGFMGSLCLSFCGIFTNQWAFFFIFGFGYGISLSLVINPFFLICNEFFPFQHPRHVFATSLMVCGYPAGSMIFNPLVYYFIDKYGYEISFSLSSIITFIVCISTTFNVTELNNLEDDYIITDENQESSSNKTDEDSTQHSFLIENQYEIDIKARIIIGIIWLFACIFRTIAYSAPNFFLVQYMVHLGIDQRIASIGMTTMSSFELISRFLASYFGEKIKGKFIIMYIFVSIILVFINIGGAFTYNFTTVVIYAVSLGIIDGPVIAALVSSCLELHNGKYFKESLSIYRIGMGIGYLIGPLMASVVFDLTGSFKIIFFCVSLLNLIAAFLFFLCFTIKKRIRHSIRGP